VVRIPNAVAQLTWTNPRDCGLVVVEAVRTEGRSVVEDMVLRQDDPPLNWVVRRDDIREDSSAPPERSS